MGSKTGIWTPTVALDLSRDNRVGDGGFFPTQSLIVGQKVTAGTAENGSIHKVSSLSEVEQLCGKGSQLYDLMKSYFSYTSTQPVYIGVLDDADTATKYSNSFTLTVTDPEAGVLGIRVNDEKYTVAVTDADTATTLGDRIVAALEDAAHYYEVTNALGVVKFECRNGGLAVGGVDVRFSPDSEDTPPTGVTVADGVVVAGTIDPDVDDVLMNVGDTYFINMWGPYADTASLQKFIDKLNTLGDKYNAADSIYHTIVRGTASTIRAKAQALRSIRFALHCIEGMKQSVNNYLGTSAREVTTSIAKDVNKPLHNLRLRGVRVWSDGLEWSERNSLAGDGVATINPETGELEAPVTCYVATDDERRWENIFALSYMRRSFRDHITGMYGQAVIITRPGATISPSKKVITLATARVSAISWYADQVRAAHAQDEQRFADELLVSLADSDTIEWFLPVTLVVPFVVGDGLISYRQISEEE